MSARIIGLACQESVDNAWRAYAELAVAQYENMGLMVDRDHQERLIRARNKWMRLRGLLEQMR